MITSISQCILNLSKLHGLQFASCKLCPDRASYLSVRRFARSKLALSAIPTKCADLDFKWKSRLLLLLESGLKYIIVIECLYSYILNVNYTETCKLLLIFCTNRWVYLGTGLIKTQICDYVKHESCAVYVHVNLVV